MELELQKERLEGYRAAAPTSSGLPRPNGMLAPSSSTPSTPCVCTSSSVRISPGAMAFTVMPKGAPVRAMDFTIPICPAFVAA